MRVKHYVYVTVASIASFILINACTVDEEDVVDCLQSGNCEELEEDINGEVLKAQIDTVASDSPAIRQR